MRRVHTYVGAATRDPVYFFLINMNDTEGHAAVLASFDRALRTY